MKALAVIPARYESTRLPGKPILEVVREVTGKYLIQHVYERAESAENISEVIVATDDERIADVVADFGGKAQITSSAHQSGTDRIAEVVRERHDCSIIVNIQGDEPELQPAQINKVVELLTENDDAVMGTLAHPFSDMDTYKNPADVKVVCDSKFNALYFSRSPIPFVRGEPDNAGKKEVPDTFLKHLGIYSYRWEALLRFSQMPPSFLERTEKLEQLRALEAGWRIKVAITETQSVGIDTPADLANWLKKFTQE